MSIDLTLDQTLLFASTANQRREMMQRAESERAEARQRELDSQWSPATPPDERIRIWENLHALLLPQTPDHPLLAVIAKHTHLSLGDIRHEQERRRSWLDTSASVTK